MIKTIDSITGNVLIRRIVYSLLGIMTAAMVVLSLVQVYILWSTQDVAAYGSVQANAFGFPQEDQRGVFLILNEPHNTKYAGDLVSILATTDPDVVATDEGAHFLSKELKGILVQTAALNENGDYHVRIDDADVGPLKYEPQEGGHDLIISPQSGVWVPGHYNVDIPAEGMDGGSTYFEFYIDQEVGN